MGDCWSPEKEAKVSLDMREHVGLAEAERRGLGVCNLRDFTSGDGVSDSLISGEGVPFIDGLLKHMINSCRVMVLKDTLGICLCTKCTFIHTLYIIHKSLLPPPPAPVFTPLEVTLLHIG